MKKPVSLFLLFAAFSMFLGPPKAAAQSPEVKAKLHAHLEKLEKKGFHGAVYLVHNNKVLLAEGYGLADRQEGIENAPSTVFDIGSITKQFTGAGILKLEMMGKLKVEDPITDYFTEVPEDKKGITIHHLLTHSAGLQDVVGDDYSAISEEEFLTKTWASKLRYPVGNRYEYSNLGYSLLALIIEKTSGTSYEAFLNTHLFTPAGMTQTGYTLPKWNSNRVAVGYTKKGAWGKPNEKPWDSNGPFLHLKGNGGILSTAEDLYKWHEALLGEKILSEAAKQKYYAPHIKENPEGSSFYGYGWALFPTPRDTFLIAHNGGNGIFFADFWRYLTEDITIILLTNQADKVSEALAAELAGIVIKSS